MKPSIPPLAPAAVVVRCTGFVSWLVVPTEPECYIPLGMTDEDFEMLEASLRLWRARIVRAKEEPANAEPSDKRGQEDARWS